MKENIKNAEDKKEIEKDVTLYSRTIIMLKKKVLLFFLCNCDWTWVWSPA
jgi:hypothetical protein